MTWQTSYYHYDGLGSTQCLTDENGDVTDSYAYTAFGEEVDTGAANPTPNPFRYVGQQGYYRDADTEDHYVRARLYRPALARWLSLDQLQLIGGSVNLYRYARQNPVYLIDPSGLAAAVPSLSIEFPSEKMFAFRKGDCGNLELWTKWKIDPPSKGGFVVQEVTLEFKAKYKGGKRDGQVSTDRECEVSLTFWECWEVTGKGKLPSGKEVPGDATDVVLGIGHYSTTSSWDDHWKGGYCICQEGTMSIVAKAAFYEGLTWNQVHAVPDMMHNNSKTPAGDILSTTVDPQFDKLPQYKNVKKLPRSLKAHYSCPVTKKEILGEKNETIIDSIDPQPPKPTK